MVCSCPDPLGRYGNLVKRRVGHGGGGDGGGDGSGDGGGGGDLSYSTLLYPVFLLIGG